jgi:hypothetical protein
MVGAAAWILLAGVIVAALNSAIVVAGAVGRR